MKTAVVVMASAVLIATIATTVAWAYPTTAERTPDTGTLKVSAGPPQSPPATQIRVILPAPWETSAPAKR